MDYTAFSSTYIGIDHLKTNMPSQDYSFSKTYDNATVLAVADGHGSPIYVRSHIGSKLAIKVFNHLILEYIKISTLTDQHLQNIKVRMICAWNESVIDHLLEHPLRHREIRKLSKEDRYRILMNPYLVYGTTFLGCMVRKEKTICIQIGDGILMIFDDTKNYVMPFIAYDDHQVANYTNSLSQVDAYDHIYGGIYDTDNIRGLFLATDGMTNPFQTFEQFARTVPMTLLSVLTRENKDKVLKDLKAYINNIAKEIGTGDDVSMASFIKF